MNWSSLKNLIIHVLGRKFPGWGWNTLNQRGRKLWKITRVDVKGTWQQTRRGLTDQKWTNLSRKEDNICNKLKYIKYANIYEFIVILKTKQTKTTQSPLKAARESTYFLKFYCSNIYIKFTILNIFKCVVQWH